MNVEEFRSAIKALGISENQLALEKLSHFYELLVEWNQKMNLTRITEREEVYLKHFYDSLTLVKSHNLETIETLCDVGSGAGFPGIVLKIFFPNLKITLIDSLQKRVRYLNEIIKELDLKNIEAIHTRAEDYARLHYEAYDLVTARAVADLRILSEICLPMVKINGFFIAMKGNKEEEIAGTMETLNILSSEILEIKEFLLPIENSHRTLIKIQKKAKTDHRYPRSMEKIQKISLKN